MIMHVLQLKISKHASTAAKQVVICRDFSEAGMQLLQEENEHLRQQLLQQHLQSRSDQSDIWDLDSASKQRLTAEVKVAKQHAVDLQRRVDKLCGYFTDSMVQFKKAVKQLLGWQCATACWWLVVYLQAALRPMCASTKHQILDLNPVHVLRATRLSSNVYTMRF